MHYLITGIDGFAGKYLAQHLLDQQQTVSGTILHESHLQNIAYLQDKITIYNCDLKNKQRIQEVISLTQPDYLIHLAGFASPTLSWKNIEETIAVNITGSINLLEAIKTQSTHSAMRSLIISSQDTYGNISDDYKEITEDIPFFPNNPYAVSKACVDSLSKLYAHHDNMQIIIARPGNHSGPGQSDLYVISDFCKQVAQIEKQLLAPIIHVGNLNADKDFTDVRDMVAAYSILVQKGQSGEAYNIASGNLYRIEDILQQIICLSKSSIEVRIDPKKFREIQFKSKPINIVKVKSATDWAPKITIKQTIEDTLNWWRQQLNN